MKIKIYSFIIFFILLSTFSHGKVDRNIIKAYDKGKPAKMDIEITKLKTTNYIDFYIDRENKKIYKDITNFSQENRDLKEKLYITDYYKKTRGIREFSQTYSYELLDFNNKKYLVVSYDTEPTNIYLWIVKNNKLQKLYTGVLNEFFDPTNPISYIDLKKTSIVKDDSKKFMLKDENFLYYKIANVQLKEQGKENISLKLKDKYAFYQDNTEISSNIDFYFKDGNSYKKTVTLTPNNKNIEIIGKLSRNLLANRKITKGFFKNLDEKNENKFSIDTNFEKTRVASKELVFKDYYINSHEKTKRRVLDIYAYGSPSEKPNPDPNSKDIKYYYIDLNLIEQSNEETYSDVNSHSSGITSSIGSTCFALSKYNWGNSKNYKKGFSAVGRDFKIIKTNSPDESMSFNSIGTYTEYDGGISYGANPDYIFLPKKTNGKTRRIYFNKLSNDVSTYKVYFNHSHDNNTTYCPNNLINIHFNSGDERIVLYTNNMLFPNLTPSGKTYSPKKTYIGVAGAHAFKITEVSMDESAELVYKDPSSGTHTLNVTNISTPDSIDIINSNRPIPNELPTLLDGKKQTYSHFFQVNGEITTDTNTELGTYNGYFNVSITLKDKSTGGRF